MRISLIYNYYEGEQDLTGKFDFDNSVLSSKKKFSDWLLELPTISEYEDDDENEEPFDAKKLDNLFFVSICLYVDKDEKVPDWYDELNGRIYFINKKPTTWRKALKHAGLA